MQGQQSVCPKGLNPAPVSRLWKGCMWEQVEEEESLFSTCAWKLHCMGEEFKIHSSVLPGGQGTSLGKEVLHFLLICMEEEFLLMEEGLNVPHPPPLVMLLATVYCVRQDYCLQWLHFSQSSLPALWKGRKLSQINPCSMNFPVDSPKLVLDACFQTIHSLYTM